MNDSIPIPLVIIVLYILLLYAITWGTRKLASRGGMVGYLLAGRGLPMGVTAVMLTGLAVGGASTIGIAEKAYTMGISAGWYNAAWAVGAIVMGIWAAGRYRKMEVSTLPELFERHYGVGGRLLGVIGQLVIQVVITSLQYVAGGAILSSLLPGILTFQQGMLVTAVVFIGITLIGGLWAAGLTNIINVSLIYVGVILGAILSFNKALGQVGGVDSFLEHLQNLSPSHPGFELGALGIPRILAWFLIMIVTALGTQAVVQISFASKGPASARGGFILGGLIILPVGFISALIGVSAVVLHPGIIATEALPKTVLGLNPFIAGLILAGLWAADVSTACGLLLGSATLVVGDIVKRFFFLDLSEKKERLISRITVLILSLITYIMACSVSGILKTLLVGLTLNTAYALITLMTLFCPVLCRKGHAVWTLLVSMLSLGAWFFFPHEWKEFFWDPIYLVLPATVIAFLFVTLVDKRPIR
jgi:SSS family solute:Na+ symporter